MLQIAQRTQISASLSIPTLDEKAWRATEPHTPNPARAPGGGRRAQSRWDSHRRADRAPDAGYQRRTAPDRAAAGASDGGRRHEHRRHGAAPARGGTRRVHGLAAKPAPGSRSTATSGCTVAAPTRRARNASAWENWSAVAGVTRPEGSDACQRRLPESRSPRAPRPCRHRKPCSEIDAHRDRPQPREGSPTNGV